ncbi:unnamed protein product [Paramecium primaurelia]|uniref:Uncharacterized protein n=1 Tax=Paramecium primaurelia TaxID=5886 RepID=A0A8S1MED6_PARPR|nr:unnamed protein product [Paramecium primaurelia]CAD8076097.1 unnamed protein product [Paramecium primaurelia]
MIVQKQTSGSGGFKMPAEIVRGKKYYQQNINNYFPTKDELFNQLGIMSDNDLIKMNDHKGDHLGIFKQFIQEKQEQLNYLPSKPPTPLVIKQIENKYLKIDFLRIRENVRGAQIINQSICRII